MNPSSCSRVERRNTGAVSRMKSFQNWPGTSGSAGGGPSRMRRSSNPFASSVPLNDSSMMKTTRCPRRRSTSPMPTQLLVGPNAPSGKKTNVLPIREPPLNAPRSGRDSPSAGVEGNAPSGTAEQVLHLARDERRGAPWAEAIEAIQQLRVGTDQDPESILLHAVQDVARGPVGGIDLARRRLDRGCDRHAGVRGDVGGDGAREHDG